MNYEVLELRTNRLIIKKGNKEDFLKVYEYDFNKLKNVDNICKLVKQDDNKINELFKKGSKSYYNKIKKAKMFDWIIYINNNPIGNILTTYEDYNNKTIEISGNIHPSYWGNGFMPEASLKVIEYLFSLGYDNIISSYLEGNIKAKRVMNKLGFKPYKIIKDLYISEQGNKLDEYKTILTKEDFLSRTNKISKIVTY